MPAEPVRRAAIGALAVLVCSAATAAGAWSPAETASVGPLAARSPDVAMNGRGDAAAAWVRGSGRKAMVVVTLRAAGGEWSRPEAVSRRGRPALDPQVSVDPTGRVVVVWRQVAGSRLVSISGLRRRKPVLVVRARERRPGETRWDRIQTLSSGRLTAGRPDLAIDERGIALATWHWGTGNTSEDPGHRGEVQVAEGRSAEPWSLPQSVSVSGSCDQLRAPRVSLGGGDAVVWWQCDLAGDQSTAFSTGRAPDQPFALDRELPFRSAGDLAADLVVSGNGTVVAVSAGGEVLHFWRGSVGADGISLQELPVAGSPPALNRDGGPPQVGVNDGGDALAAWIGSDQRARAAVIAADLGVAAPAALDPGKQGPAGVRVAVGDGQQGLVAWTASGRVISSSRAGDGSLAAGTRISDVGVSSGQAPAVAMDDAGGGVAFWTRVVAGHPVVERAELAAP